MTDIFGEFSVAEDLLYVVLELLVFEIGKSYVGLSVLFLQFSLDFDVGLEHFPQKEFPFLHCVFLGGTQRHVLLELETWRIGFHRLELKHLEVLVFFVFFLYYIHPGNSLLVTDRGI